MLAVAITARYLEHAGTIHLGAGIANPLCQWDQFAPGMLAAMFLFKKQSIPKWFTIVAGIAGVALIATMLHRYLSVSLSVAADGVDPH